MDIQLTVNGDDRTLAVDPDELLVDALRDAGYTGVKCGCDGGVCGASKVLVDGEVRMACDLAAEDAADADVITVEGLGSQDDLHPVQAAFVDNFAVQCGFCTPGMVIQGVALLEETPNPSEAEVRAALDDNLCRCTGYQKPVEAILEAAERMDEVAADGGRPTRDGGTHE